MPFLSNRQLQVFRDGNSSQQYLVNAVAPEGSIVGPTLFPLYVNEFLMILSIVSMLIMLLSNLSVIKYLICNNN